MVQAMQESYDEGVTDEFIKPIVNANCDGTIKEGDVVVSLDVFQETFLCDLGDCKGACCIEGDAGAPVELEAVSYTHLSDGK